MDLTTTTRVKARITVDASDVQYDALLSSLIARASAEAERIMNRKAEAISRTAQFDVSVSMRSLSLPAYPVSSITTIWNDRERDFGNETTIATADYYSDDAAGLVYFEVALAPGPGVLKITYTGGMGASTAAFIAAYPDIAEAIDERVAQLWQRRDEIGLTGVTGAQGSVSRVNDDWPPNAMAILKSHRRWGSA